jgi:hypothetical protein
VKKIKKLKMEMMKMIKRIAFQIWTKILEMILQG